MIEMKFTNLLGVEVVEKKPISPIKIQCYLCGECSENISDFEYCGANGFAHPYCNANQDEQKTI